MDEKKLIYRRMTGRAIWALVPMVLVPIWLAAAEDNDPINAVIASPVALAILIGTFWVAIGWNGRRRPAQVWALDGRLLVQCGDLFDAGAIVDIPLDETRAWRWSTERHRRGMVDIVNFEYGPQIYTLELDGAEFFDRDAIAALVASGSGVMPNPVERLPAQAAK